MGCPWRAIGFVLKWLFQNLLTEVDPTVAAALVAAVATTLVSVATVVYGRYRERRDALDREIREKKIPMYSELVEELFAIFKLGTDEEPTAEDSQRLGDFMVKITPLLITWASDEVLATWSRYRRRAADLEGAQSLFEPERLLLAIRRDFGHNNKGLAKGDSLGLFVNDIDDYVADQK